MLIETVKTVDNSNIYTITLKEDLKFEELHLLKDILCQYNGSDPVTIKLKEYDDEVKILTSSMFWVESSNDLTNALKKQFKDKIEINIRSLDSTEHQELTTV